MNAPFFLKAGLSLGLLVSPALAQGIFTSVDIGRTTPAGQTVVQTNGYDVSSSTGDIWDFGDDFRFAYQAVAGDFDIQVRIHNFLAGAYWSKAGLMVRQNLTTSAINGMMVATQNSPRGWGRYFYISRWGAGSSTFSFFQSSLVEGRVSYSNTWVRLVRIGNDITSFHGTNGFTWTQIGTRQATGMPTTAYVGMAVSAHPDAFGVKATAQFRNLRLVRGLPSAPVVITQPISQTVNPGASASISVTAVGAGTLTYQWHRDGVPMAGATSPGVGLTNVQFADAGKLTCLVRNATGEVMSWAAQLEVVEGGQPFDAIVYDRFNAVPGKLIEYFINSPKFPDKPDFTGSRTFFEAPSNIGDDIAGRIRGYVTAPLTGNYRFYIAADDQAELWVSSDDNPANRRMVAFCPFWVTLRNWSYYLEQTSDPIPLLAGKRYYVEALYKEEGGDDHCSVGWMLPDARFERPIPASRFRGLAASFSSMQRGGSGNFHLTVDGTVNSLYVLQASTNLINWTAVLTNRVPFLFEELETAILPKRFYRAITSR